MVSANIIDENHLAVENASLRERLHEAEQTLDAIRSGEVDALVIGDHVYTLESADAASDRFRGEVLAQINEAVVAVDNEDRVTYLNPAAERQYGISSSDALGRPLDQLYEYEWPDAAAETSAAESLRRDGFWRGENIHRKRSGDEIYVESTVNVLRDRDDNSVGFLAVVRDITHRKLAEQTLQRKEQELRDFVENASIGMHWVGPDGIILWANRAELQMLGYTEEEYVGHHIAQFHAQPAAIDEMLTRLSGGEVLNNFEAELIAKDGSIRHTIINSDVLWEGDRFVHTRCFTRDVTDRKLAEQALMASQERLEKALAIETVGVMFFDLKGFLIGSNDAFMHMSGYSRDEISSGTISWRDLTPEEWVDRSSHAMEELLGTGRIKPYEKEYLRKDGTRFWGLFAASRLSENEAVEYVLDITPRKIAEENLRRANDELEERVVERTRQLAHAIAALQKEMSEHVESEAQRGELLKKLVTTQEDERSRIARDIHDQLGQRVTALRLQLASLIEATADETSAVRHLKLLQEMAERLDAEVGFLAWELRPAALDDLGFPEAAKAFLDEWSLHYSIPAELHIAGRVDRRLKAEVETHLYRIMQEALNNITKHAEATEVNVLLKADGDDISFIVEDNGKGFDTSSLPDPNRSTSGLGLLGMRERALLIGGDVEIESSPGSGTTIFVRIPGETANSGI